MKWFEVAAAGVLTAAVLVLVLAGLQQRPSLARHARGPEVAAETQSNFMLIAPPTIHERIGRPTAR